MKTYAELYRKGRYRKQDKKPIDNKIVRKSASSENYITLDEHSLTAMLKGEEFTPKKNSKKQLILRF